MGDSDTIDVTITISYPEEATIYTTICKESSEKDTEDCIMQLKKLLQEQLSYLD